MIDLTKMGKVQLENFLGSATVAEQAEIDHHNLKTAVLAALNLTGHPKANLLWEIAVEDSGKNLGDTFIQAERLAELLQ